MLRCFVFMGKSWIFVEDSFVFHESEPSQALRARFPLLSPAVTSSPGRGKSALKGTPLGNAGNFAATPEAVPLGKVAANVVSRRKGWFPGLQVSQLKHKVLCSGLFAPCGSLYIKRKQTVSKM